MDGELRWPGWSSSGPPSCTDRSLAAECPASGAWHDTQAWRPDADSEVSLKIFWPRTAWADRADSGDVASAAGPVPPPPQAASQHAAQPATTHVDTLRITPPPMYCK